MNLSQTPKYQITRKRAYDLSPVYYNGLSRTHPDIKRLFGCEINKQWMVYTEGKLLMVFNHKDLETMQHHVAQRIFSEPEWFESMLEKNIEIQNRAIARCKRLADLKNNMTDPELISALQEMIDLFIEFDNVNIFLWLGTAELLKERIKKNLEISGLSSYEIELLLRNSNPSFKAEEKKAVLQTAIKWIDCGSDESDINNLVKSYFWSSHGFDGKAGLNDAEHYIKQVRKAQNESRAEIAKKIEELDMVGLKIKQNRIYAKVTDSDKELVKRYQNVFYWMDTRKATNYELSTYFHELLQKYGERNSIKLQNLKYVTVDELKRMDKKGIVDLANERMKSTFIVENTNGTAKFIYRHEAEKMFRTFVGKTGVQKDIKGTVAVGKTGTVRGRAAVVTDPSQLDKIKKGDIIVTHMTTPDFTDSMMLTKAVVTDEGGLLCHAAILCREFSKPCIVGTGFATDKIKHGEEIELNMETGEVKILGPNESKQDSAQKIVEKKKYSVGFQEKYNTLLIDCLAQATVQYPHVIGNNIPEFFAFVDKTNRVEVYYSKESQDKVNAEHGKYFLDTWKIEALISKYKEIIMRHNNLLRRMQKTDLSGLSDDELAGFVNEFFKFMVEMIAYYRSTRYEAEVEPANAIKLELAKHFVGEIDKIFTVICDSPKKNLILREKENWVRLLQAEFCEADVLDHINRFASYFINILDQKDIMETLRMRHKVEKATVKKMMDEVAARNRDLLELPAKHENIYRICESDNLIAYSKMLQEFGFYRFEIKDLWAGTELRFMPLFKEVCKRIDETTHGIYNYYTIQNIMDSLERGKGISSEELDRRKECMAILIKNRQCYVTSGKDASEQLKIPRESFEKQNVVKGTIGYKGIVRGYVRKMYPESMENISDVATFKEGDILVTTATQPSMVPIMMKASAFVSDFGGVTSHCGIVARELKKPCVLATKIGSRSFEDGDYVEVNAEEGYVKKIDPPAR